MATRTITMKDTTFNGVVARATFANGTADVDDTTVAGLQAINFAKRHGWSVSGSGANSNASVPETVPNGKPVSRWTTAECKAYLDDKQVTYPANASATDLKNAVLTAYETRAQGGSAALPTAGHVMGTFPVQGAPIVPGDDATKAAKWETPLTGNDSDVGGEVAATISVQPASVSVVHPATATFTVTASGTPTPKFQWRKAESTAPTVFADIAGATGASYTTGATSIAADNGDKYEVVVTNGSGDDATVLTSSVATLTVT